MEKSISTQIIFKTLGAALACACLAGSSRAVVVAVIDTGVDRDHPALAGSLWTNPGESGVDTLGRDKATNGIDDDGNGFVDDVHGWNFVNNSNVIADSHGHGTHIAGLIVAGKGPHKPKIMALKYYDPLGSDADNMKNSVRALHYANQMGARIINYSGGGYGFNESEKAAVEESYKKGILIIAAVGNDRINADVNKFYPAGYGFSNILSVAATDDEGRMLASSNFGEKTVDIAAPGAKLLSALPKGQFGYMSGTSQATAFVSRVAARLFESKPLPLPDLKQKILALGVEDKQLKTKYKIRLSARAEDGLE